MTRARDLADGTFNSDLAVEAGNGATALLTLNNADGNGTLSKINLGYNADPDHGNITYTGDLIFTAGASEKARIRSGGGITFNGDTAAANALDDYEEGTWTPTVVSGTLNFAYGNYRKIGSMVWVSFYIQGFSDTTTTNAIRVGSLPFTNATETANGAAGAVWSQYCSVIPAATYVASSSIYLYASSTSAQASVKYSNITSGTNCSFFGEATYWTN